MPYVDADEEQEIDAAFDKVDAQHATIRRLKTALRNLASVPAIGTLGQLKSNK